MPTKWPLGFFATIALVISASALSETKPNPQAFSTLQGLGFDKQASIWLVEKHITPGAPVRISEESANHADSIYFDEPGGKYFRDADQSTYEKLLLVSPHQSDYLNYFKTTVFDIEINLWLPDKATDSRVVETSYRTLQERWGRAHVPHSCYTEFFDQLQLMYERDKNLAAAHEIPGKLACWRDELASNLKDAEVLVSQMPVQELLGHIRSGAKVAYVDVREPEEFAENHIPGAINLTIRDANRETVAQLEQYDVVVAYCVKDFRGFEMARKLRNLGIRQSAILSPFGIKGWIGSGLPVYKVGQVSEAQAVTALQLCVSDPDQCPTPAPAH